MKCVFAIVSCLALMAAGCADDHSPPRGRADRPDLEGSAVGSGGAMEPEKESSPSGSDSTDFTFDGDIKNYKE